MTSDSRQNVHAQRTAEHRRSPQMKARIRALIALALIILWGIAALTGLLLYVAPAGPPLVHAIYRPAHHADMTFTLAIRRGVAAHHWRFGNMPPQPAVGEEEIGLIVRYVRELQLANGID